MIMLDLAHLKSPILMDIIVLVALIILPISTASPNNVFSAKTIIKTYKLVHHYLNIMGLTLTVRVKD